MDLGQTEPLVPVLRANDALWVQVSVGGIALSGRTRLQAAPYVLADSDSLADLQCQAGDTVRFDGSNWACAPSIDAKTFGCKANPWSQSANVELCRVTVTLATESLVVASASGHWSTDATANWCIVEIVFPGETTYHNRASGYSPYIDSQGAHGYPGPASEDFSTTRRTILPAGSHDIYLYASENSVCNVNGSSMLGWAIPVR